MNRKLVLSTIGQITMLEALMLLLPLLVSFLYGDGCWLYPEEILGNPSLSACLNREAFYQSHRELLSRLSGEMRVPRGHYVSWQGERLQALGIAVQSVTYVPLVICQAETGDRGLWAVPLSRWTQPVRTPEGTSARYTFLSE